MAPMGHPRNYARPAAALSVNSVATDVDPGDALGTVAHGWPMAAAASLPYAPAMRSWEREQPSRAARALSLLSAATAQADHALSSCLSKCCGVLLYQRHFDLW